MPRPRLPHHFRHLLDHLASGPTDELIRRVGGELAPVVARMPDPGRSLGAFLRRFRDAGVSDATRDAVRVIVLEKLAPHISPSASSSEIGTQEVARLTGQSLKTLLQQLKSPAYRRLYGWPIWRGNSWGFVREAVDPVTSRQYLATLPEQEPAAIAALLPAWCERAPATEREVSRDEPSEGAQE
ncbi:MAG TPA: hypothetical protein VL328_10510 [Gemmatimonadaceae bacterium]|nr:hypothetical protein [Gemmatimonadaceae bacterium]